MVFFSDGMASMPGENFCFLVDTEDDLSSGFLFFARIAWACSSLKLHGAELVDVVSGSCVLGLGSVMGPVAGGEGLCDKFSLADTAASVLGDVCNLNTIRGRGNCWAIEGALLADTASTPAQGVVNATCCMTKGITSACDIGSYTGMRS